MKKGLPHHHMSIMNLLIYQKSNYGCWMVHINVIKDDMSVLREFTRHKLAF